jgi:protocatechuate 3,4-dioxygenase beta subunit
MTTKNLQRFYRSTTTNQRTRRSAARDPRFLLEYLENRQLLSAAVTTDKPDYEPGETAVIVASGFNVGETVALQVSRSDGATDAEGLEPWSLRDGGAGDLDGIKNGSIKTSWYVNPDALGQSFVLTVVGSSGARASTNFTDARGAIWTTLADGSVQDANVQYQSKEEVYLHGHHFEEGDYYIRVVQTQHQVTVGESILLGSGTLHIDASGSFGPISVWDLVYKTSDGSQGFDDSANAEYNVDVADNPEFKNPKQDNFRIKPEGPSGNPGLDVAIAGHKFNDLNGNGVADAGEPGLPDWAINVDGNVVATTDADGNWSWILQEGNHTIQEVNQPGWTQTGVVTYNVGIFESGFTGIPDGGLTAFDFLNFQNSSITGTKFYDANANGVADDTQVVPNWTIVLDNDTNHNNGNLATTQTAADGTYSFDNLAPGTYYVYETMQAGWMQVYGQATYTVVIGPNGVQSGGTSSGNNFGNIQQTPIGGHKFEDHNGNGVVNNGDQGLAGWSILVDGNVVDTTDANGVWSAILTDGSHTIQEVNQNGWTQTGVVTYNITVSHGAVTSGAPTGGANAFDFLNFQNGSITGTKFYDANANGVADDTQVVPNWTIVLDNDTNHNNGNLATTQTDANGHFSFTNLAPGTYYVYETMQAGWMQVYGQATYTVVVGANGVQSGGTSSGNNFGNIQQVPIGGYKYEDHNGNGVEDEGDQGLAGWHILLDGHDVATTEADGGWDIIVTDGNHTIQEVNQTGWTQTGVVTYNINVSHGVVTGDVPDEGTDEFNFLNFHNVSITGTKFYDANGNGIADDTQTVPNWTIVLDSDTDHNNGNLASTQTDANGHFSFTNLAPGTYYVYEVMQAGWTQVYGAAVYTIIVGANGVQSGGTSTGNDFGNVQQTPIGGYKYEDHNGNGVEDEGDQGLAGWHILLDGHDVATTDADGGWDIMVTDGNHTIQEVNQAGWTQTGVVTYNITVSQGVVTGDVPEEGTDEFNFLNFHNVSITGTKFFDANANGIADDTQTVANWTIYLDNDTNLGNGTIAATTTAADGTFSFTNIAPGTYYVYEGMQANWIQTYGPASYTITVGADGVQSGGSSTGNIFGNLHLQPGPSEHTLGFWSNKNGQAVMNDGGTMAPELAFLSSLNLVQNIVTGKDITGATNFDPTNYTDFRNWILGANGKNMAVMLSAQLATTELSVEAGFLNAGTMIDTGSMLLAFSGQITGLNVVAGHGFISIGNLMNAGNTQLGLDNLTLSGDANRPIQDAIKSALDALNNNQLLVVA